MLRIHFTSQDLTRTTLAEEPDPLWEVLLSLHQLQGRDGAGQYGYWRERTRRQFPRHAERLLHLTPPRGYSPDFLTPPPAGGSFDDAVEQVLSTAPRRMNQELEMVRRPGSSWTRDLAVGRRDAVNGLGQSLRIYHRHAIAPYWDSIRASVRGDLHQQVSRLTTSGVDDLLSNLHPAVRWERPVLKIMGFAERDLHLEGRGLRLQPSVFCWRTPTKLRDPQLSPVLVYPVREAPGMLHLTSVESRTEPLAALLGSTRASALAAISDVCTTTELARRCDISLAGASRQAGILREAGLITTRRAGQAVLHDLTPLGKALLDGSDLPIHSL
ncbi:winged helix-turn-helix domain-containing protein [Kribbella sp. NPDC051718]|uniref:ArsR/SmtB family transcription factor n=1 Tax=Kribbella sp. NPDC051718 TaxID=3155168 RepID=UPI0034278F15